VKLRLAGDILSLSFGFFVLMLDCGDERVCDSDDDFVYWVMKQNEDVDGFTNGSGKSSLWLVVLREA